MANEVHGKNAVFKLTDAGSVLQDLSSYLKTDGLQRSADEQDSTVKGESSHNYAPGLFDGQTKLEGLWDPTIDGILAGVLNTKKAFEYYPAGLGTGNIKYSGFMLINSFEVSAPNDALVTFTAEMKVSGDVTRTVL